MFKSANFLMTTVLVLSMVSPTTIGFGQELETAGDGRQISSRQDDMPRSVVESFEPIRVASNELILVNRQAQDEGSGIPAILQKPVQTRPQVVEQRRADIRTFQPEPQPGKTQSATQAPLINSDLQAPLSSRTPTSGNRSSTGIIPPTHLNNDGQNNFGNYRPSNPIKPVSLQRKSAKIDSQIEMPAYLNLHQPANIKLTIVNNGDVAAASVKVLADIPAHAKFVKSNPAPIKMNEQRYEFQLFDLAAQQSREISIELIPTEKKPIDMSAEIVVENAQRFSVSVREPRIKLNLQGPAEVKLGQSINHKVLIENIGDGLAERVSLEAVFPNQLRLARKTGLVIPTIEPGQKIEIEMPSQAMSAGNGEISVSISGNGIETQVGKTSIRVLQPELEIAASGPQLNFVNREGVYTIGLKNTGEANATNVAISLKVPRGLKVTTISHEAKVDAKTNTLTWNFEQIPANTERSVKFIAVATEAGQQDCIFTINSVETTAKTIHLATNVVTRPELNVKIVNLSGPIQVGGKTEFLITVENSGSSLANDVTVSIELPEALVPDRQNGVEIISLGNAMTFETEKLQPGQKKEFRFTAVASEQGEHVVKSILTSSSSTRQITSEAVIYVYELNQSRVSESVPPAVIR